MEETIRQKNWIAVNPQLYERLAASVASGHLCHAYLFFGERGVGKKTMAMAFAQMILCADPSAGRPCGLCRACRKFSSGNHPDFYVYEGRQGANSIHIETIRALRADAYIRPNDSEYKVYLIPNSEDMSAGAANALLKVLEEPPAHAVFLLTANNRELVPQTIRSRCISIPLYPMAPKPLEDALAVLEPQESAERRRSAAALSGGVLGRALELLQQENGEELSALCRQAGQALCQWEEYSLLLAFTQCQTKERLQSLFKRLSSLLREALIHQLGVVPSEDPLAVRMAASLTAGQIEALFQLLEEGVRGIEGNINLNLVCGCLAGQCMRALGSEYPSEQMKGV